MLVQTANRILLIFGFVSLLLGQTPAIAQNQSVTSAQFEQCMASPNEYGGTTSQVYVAWANGLAHTCLYSEFSRSEARAFALSQCERSMGVVRRRLGVTERCSIVVDQGVVVDQRYRNALRPTPPFPVSLTVYDAVSEEVQNLAGVYSDRATQFDGPNPIEFGFEIRTGNLIICEGILDSHTRSFRLNFRADCLGDTFSGTARAAGVVLFNDILVVVPETVRVRSSMGSWIEFRFL